jgi:hypothetical protein
MDGNRSWRDAVRIVMRWVIVVLALASCGTEQPAASQVAARPPTSTPTTTMPPATPSPAPLRAIEVGALPREGIAVDLGHAVVLLDLDGRVLDRLPGSSLYYNWTVPGEVVLRRRRTFFVLHVARGAFQPLPSREAAFGLDPQFQSHVGLPRPVSSLAGIGRWTYALPGPNGLVLAQWSGECEAANAMFVSAGKLPVGVTGERRLSRAAESRALGWDDRGRAIVDLPEGACGTSFARPGIYAFTGPGVGELVYPDADHQGARMWGPEA